MKTSRRSFLTLSGAAILLPDQTHAKTPASEPAPWWETAVAYEIYPRSFQDGNGDGIGDFIGMANRVDYLADLGIDAVWVAACFDSPNADNGYDVRDYRKIMPDFGTMDDFDRFLSRATQRGIRVILDMVFNHTSDEHPWFVRSRASRDNPWRDFYHWHDGKNGGPPTNWNAVFGGPAWTLDPATGQYYLHTFAVKQPDVNWENPDLRKELYDILRFWAAKGVSGFRFDAITSIAKPAILSDLPARLANGYHNFADHGERMHFLLRDMNREVFAGTSLYSVGEAYGVDRRQITAMTAASRHELTSAFRFDLVLGNKHKTMPAAARLRAFNASNAFDDTPNVWPLVWLEDHDFPRAVSRYGSRRPEYRQRSAKLLLTMLLSLRGTPYIYQGQEIGMENYPFRSIDDYNDISARNGWHEQVESGKITARAYLADLAQNSRDNARTPMQWDTSPHAGFTTASATPWLAVNPNYKTINAASEKQDKKSVLSYCARMIRIRKTHPRVIHGRYKDVSPESETLYAYERTDRTGTDLIVLNFSDRPAQFFLPRTPASLVISNISDTALPRDTTLHLRPWESLILTL
ncbi:glucohydrolase [Acetobacter musti]|uniref:Glucohydrolase n=1 Tax=Acetobacter musti TaxID=864732 RepID=A0ABX0JNB7_9PROT|nr:alpha-glucosidase [Acetobacter musti]NHN84495.1 glucohydrolase [Acetobacter musti]